MDFSLISLSYFHQNWTSLERKVITFGGYREPITLQQIRSNLEMESHEERLHNMIKQSKVESAKDQARAAATTIREKRDSAMEGIGGGGGGPMGMGGGDFNRDRGYSGSPSSFQPPSVPTPDVPSISAAPSRPAAVKGMSLMAAGGKNKSLEDALYKEDKLMPVIPKAIPSSSSGAAPPPAPTPSIVHPIMLVLNERVNCSATRDGSIESFDVKGSLTLTASDDDVALCSVQMNATQSEMFNFTTHPKVNKAVYEQSGLLQLKDTTKGFPSQRPVGILKWSHSSATEDFVPLKINCWPEEEARGQINVSIEYSMEQSLVLHNVVIRIPLGTSNPPNIISMDGMYKHNAQAGELLWTVDMIDSSNSSGSLEFSIQQRDTDAFFPINVEFSSPQLYCDLEVQQVVAAGSGAAIQYGLSKGLSTEEYTIV